MVAFSTLGEGTENVVELDQKNLATMAIGVRIVNHAHAECRYIHPESKRNLVVLFC